MVFGFRKSDPSPKDQPPTPKEAGWFSRLRAGLSKTRHGIASLFRHRKLDEALLEELEERLLMADCGVSATTALMQRLRDQLKKHPTDDAREAQRILRDALANMLKPLEYRFAVDRAKPYVLMVAGVNGAGKTTSIGKLTHWFQDIGYSIVLAAGDTFRAAAREQLMTWGERNHVTVIAQQGGDPAAVAFDAISAAKARDTQIVIVDTAGRLPTQLHLMEELKKVKRVIDKAQPDAPHDIVLVIDANNGQNALQQVKAFHEALGLTALVVTKLDGTAKGGILAAIAAGSNQTPTIPVAFIGVGESLTDLRPFTALDYANAVVGWEDETDD